LTMQPAKTPVRLIIGYGNPLRGDDGIGWHVSQELAAHLQDPDIEVLPCHQLTPELAEKISHAQLVLFIDATCEGSPGEWSCDEIRPDCEAAIFSHNASPSGLLRLVRSLYGVAPPAWLFTVCGNSFEYGESLSPAVRKCLPDLLAKIVNVLTAMPLTARFSPAPKITGA
jgi:hydrogenase maturation protease